MVYGNITAESLEARGGRTTETTITQEQCVVPFQVVVIDKLRRLCELCVSAVDIRSCKIKTWGLREKTAEAQRTRRTNDGDYYYSGAMCCSFSGIGN